MFLRHGAQICRDIFSTAVVASTPIAMTPPEVSVKRCSRPRRHSVRYPLEKRKGEAPDRLSSFVWECKSCGLIGAYRSLPMPKVCGQCNGEVFAPVLAVDIGRVDLR